MTAPFTADSRRARDGTLGLRGIDSRPGPGIHWWAPTATMTTPWLSIRSSGEERRVPLDRSVLRIGGPGADVVVPGVGTGQLHVWTRPPKAIRVGGGPELFVAGRRVEEALLDHGVVAVWGGLELTVGGLASVLEELPPEPAAVSSAALSSGPSTGPSTGGRAVGGLGPNAQRAHDRLEAGLLVELGLADKEATKRWQASVLRGEWDPDACARDVLDRRVVDAEDPRLLERAGRLQRDLVMASFQRGLRKAGRSFRGAARKGSAMLLANVLAFLCFSLIIVAIAFLLRVRWDVSFDGYIDRVLDLFG